MKQQTCHSSTQQGYVLITSLVILFVITLITVTLSLSSRSEEMMAGNIREKTRAFNAAQTTLNHAEWWLTQGNNATTGVTCPVNPTQIHSSAAIVCSNPPVTTGTPATLSWNSYVDYTPPNMTVSATGGTNTYYSNPGFYIYYLGLGPQGKSRMYQITAFAYGGDQSSIAVVQANYKLTSNVVNLGGL